MRRNRRSLQAASTRTYFGMVGARRMGWTLEPHRVARPHSGLDPDGSGGLCSTAEAGNDAHRAVSVPRGARRRVYALVVGDVYGGSAAQN